MKAQRQNRHRRAIIVILSMIALSGSIYFPFTLISPFGIPVQVIMQIDSAGRTLSLPIIRQPIDNPAWVPVEPDVIALFDLALNYGSYGLIAHDHLAGKYFKALKVDQQIWLFDSVGQQRLFIIYDFREYQAINPQSIYTDFIDLCTGDKLSVAQVFMETYGVPGRVIMQTSIKRYDVEAWGRLFIIAIPDKIIKVRPVRNAVIRSVLEN